MNLSELLQRRKQTMEFKKSGTTQLVHPDPDALRIAYMIYEKDAKCNTWMKFVEKLKDHFTIIQVTPEEIVEHRVLLSRQSVDGPAGFDILFVGGGMPAEHYRQMRNESGRDAIQEAVGKHGVGYIGTCAGAYTAIHWHQTEPLFSFSPSWQLLPDCTIMNHEEHQWHRGMGTSMTKITDHGQRVFQIQDEEMEMFFRNGPLFNCPTDREDLQLLGTFSSNVNTTKNPFESMIDTGAIVSGQYGKGRVLLFSAHPESSGDHVNELFINSFRYAANKT